MKRRQPASRVRIKPETVWKYLNRLNVSQNKLARRVGISSGYLSQLMSGTRGPGGEIPGIPLMRPARRIPMLFAPWARSRTRRAGDVLHDD